MPSKDIYIELYHLGRNISFKKYFNTEFERDKFRRKLKYSKNLVEIHPGDYIDNYDLEIDYDKPLIRNYRKR